MKGSKSLKIGSILEIVISIVLILALRGLMGSEKAFIGVTEGAAADILGGAAGLYAAYIFQIIAGLIGLAMANKKSVLTVIIGAVLFFAQLIPFLHLAGNIALYVVHIILMVIPYLYLSGAYKNLRG